MVTAKKVTVKKSTEAVPTAMVKPVAAKKAVAKKVVNPVVPTPKVTVAAVAPQAAPEPKAKAKAPAKTKAKVSATPSTLDVTTKAALSIEQRNHYVQVAAFYIAERRGFAPGNPTDDWAAAEAEVDRLIASNNFAT